MDGRGESFGAYRLLWRLHVGLHAEVWRAEATTGPLSGRPLALKRALPTAAEDDRRRARFEAEIALSRLVSHPELVPLLDTGEWRGLPFLVHAYVRGWSLAALRDGLLARGERLPPRLAATTGAAVARALAALHAAGVVHLDVTPANVLVGVDGTVRLADLGAAVSTGLGPAPGDADRGATTLLAPQVTPGYRPPERAGSAAIAPSGDVWQLAVVLAELLEGRRAGDGLDALRAPDEPEDGPTLGQVDGPSLAPLLASMAADDPAARPSAARVAKTLGAAAGDPDDARSALASFCRERLPTPPP